MLTWIACLSALLGAVVVSRWLLRKNGRRLLRFFLVVNGLLMLGAADRRGRRGAALHARPLCSPSSRPSQGGRTGWPSIVSNGPGRGEDGLAGGSGAVDPGRRVTSPLRPSARPRGCGLCRPKGGQPGAKADRAEVGARGGGRRGEADGGSNYP